MIWTGLLLAMALSSLQGAPIGGSSTETPTIVSRTHVLDIPDELAPAVVPYMNCLVTSMGHVARNERGAVPPSPGVSQGSDCSLQRQQAQTLGEQLLERRGMTDPEQRRQRVDSVLSGARDFLMPPMPVTGDETEDRNAPSQ
jgi:hypothetical protein